MSKHPAITEATPSSRPSERRDPEWRRWMQDLGRELRRMRELTGLSQDELARRAGVSQGAVSRLEKARGLATPMVVVMRISLAVAAELRKLDGSLLDDEVRAALERQNMLLQPLAERGAHPLRIAGDPSLEELVTFYRTLPPRQRQSLVAVLRAVVAALKPGIALVALCLVGA
jgi:transcriptional regulator with XRE-family HTH domain